MAAAMTLFKSINDAPKRSVQPGFVPYQSEDAVARQLLRPLFDNDREALLLAGFDAFDRLIRLERADGDTTGRCFVPARCWRLLLDRGIATVVMAHNHPSGIARPSDADRRATHEAVLFLRTLGIDLADHLIFVESGHFSFQRARLL
jgi:DNA repair protein RadC